MTRCNMSRVAVAVRLRFYEYLPKTYNCYCYVLIPKTLEQKDYPYKHSIV